MKLEQTQFGFQWGAALIERTCSDFEKQWVCLSVSTPKKDQDVRIYVSKTGKTRVYKNGVELK